MLRGVNKQIIEVNNTGNRYFDKAVLFINPQFADISRHKLDIEANKYIESLGKVSADNGRQYLNKNTKKGIIRISLIFCVSILLLVLFVYFLFL